MMYPNMPLLPYKSRTVSAIPQEDPFPLLSGGSPALF
jgi:hypothetical protein